MNNIIKGIKLIISGLFSPFKIITDKIYFMIGKKYYWVSLLEKVEELKEDMNDKSSHITETANDLVDLIGQVHDLKSVNEKLENHHREIFETHLSKIAENRDNISDLKDNIDRVENRLIDLIKGLELRVAEVERNQRIL